MDHEASSSTVITTGARIPARCDAMYTSATAPTSTTVTNITTSRVWFEDAHHDELLEGRRDAIDHSRESVCE